MAVRYGTVRTEIVCLDRVGLHDDAGAAVERSSAERGGVHNQGLQLAGLETVAAAENGACNE